MRDIEELKDRASEVISAASEVAGTFTEKAIEVGVPAAQKTIEVTKSKLSDLEAHGEAALTSLEKHAKGKKKGCPRRAFGWTLAAAGAGGIAYLLWRRSRPVEDPWAEEYWVDLKDEEGPEGVVVEDVDAELDEAIIETIEEALADSPSEDN